MLISFIRVKLMQWFPRLRHGSLRKAYYLCWYKA